MKKSKNTTEYFRLINKGDNLYAMETITTEGDKIVSRTETEPTYMVIAFDILRKHIGRQFLGDMS